ncbi:MAG: phytoene desaturase family protein [Candidatus Hodarchaeales archaeon]|jgi:phytoene desaturase
MNSNDKNIIVIGSGIGGLSSAIRMQAAGYNVTILERRDQIGGRAGVYKMEGFTFDAGPTVITAPFLIEDLFKEAGRNMNDYVTLLPVHPYYRIFFDDKTHFDYDHPDKNIELIKQDYPEDAEGYIKMVEDVKPIFEKGFLELSFKPFDSFASMLKVAPALINLKSYKTNYQFVSKFLKSEKLRIVFSFHPLLIGGNPFSVPSIYSLIQYLEKTWGVYFAKGGTTALVHGLAKLFTDIGGKIVLNAEVNKINVENKHVQSVITTNDTFDASIVISNADVAMTYMNMIDKKWRKKNKDRKYKKANYSMSLFLIYFGTKKQYPEMKHHTIILGPRYKELLKDIFDKKILADDFSSYLHVPTRTDPSLAPPDHDAFYILVPVPHQDSGIEWDNIKHQFRDKVMKFLDENYLPGLLDNLVVEKIFTPKDFENEYMSYKGSAFSLNPIFRQSAYFRTHNRSEDVKGLYFVGAGTHPGAGVPGVISSAKLTADLIQEDFGVHEKKKFVKDKKQSSGDQEIISQELEATH